MNPNSVHFLKHVKGCQKSKLKKKRKEEFLIVFSRSVPYVIYAGGQLNPTSVGFLLALAKQGNSVKFSTP